MANSGAESPGADGSMRKRSRLRPEMERAIEAIQEMAPGDGLARVVLVGAPDVHQARAFAAADEQILLRLGSSKAQGANHPRMPLFERTHSYLLGATISTPSGKCRAVYYPAPGAPSRAAFSMEKAQSEACAVWKQQPPKQHSPSDVKPLGANQHPPGKKRKIPYASSAAAPSKPSPAREEEDHEADDEEGGRNPRARAGRLSTQIAGDAARGAERAKQAWGEGADMRKPAREDADAAAIARYAKHGTVRGPVAGILTLDADGSVAPDAQHVAGVVRAQIAGDAARGAERLMPVVEAIRARSKEVEDARAAAVLGYVAKGGVQGLVEGLLLLELADKEEATAMEETQEGGSKAGGDAPPATSPQQQPTSSPAAEEPSSATFTPKYRVRLDPSSPAGRLRSVLLAMVEKFLKPIEEAAAKGGEVDEAMVACVLQELKQGIFRLLFAGIFDVEADGRMRATAGGPVAEGQAAIKGRIKKLLAFPLEALDMAEDQKDALRVKMRNLAAELTQRVASKLATFDADGRLQNIISQALLEDVDDSAEAVAEGIGSVLRRRWNEALQVHQDEPDEDDEEAEAKEAEMVEKIEELSGALLGKVLQRARSVGEAPGGMVDDMAASLVGSLRTVVEGVLPKAEAMFDQALEQALPPVINEVVGVISHDRAVARFKDAAAFEADTEKRGALAAIYSHLRRLVEAGYGFSIFNERWKDFVLSILGGGATTTPFPGLPPLLDEYVDGSQQFTPARVWIQATYDALLHARMLTLAPSPPVSEDAPRRPRTPEAFFASPADAVLFTTRVFQLLRADWFDRVILPVQHKARQPTLFLQNRIVSLRAFGQKLAAAGMGDAPLSLFLSLDLTGGGQAQPGRPKKSETALTLLIGPAKPLDYQEAVMLNAGHVVTKEVQFDRILAWLPGAARLLVRTAWDGLEGWLEEQTIDASRKCVYVMAEYNNNMHSIKAVYDAIGHGLYGVGVGGTTVQKVLVYYATATRPGFHTPAGQVQDWTSGAKNASSLFLLECKDYAGCFGEMIASFDTYMRRGELKSTSKVYDVAAAVIGAYETVNKKKTANFKLLPPPSASTTTGRTK